MRTYIHIVYGVGLSIVIIAMAFALIMTLAALIDVVFDIGWGYTWKDVGGGALVSVGTLEIGLFIRLVFRIVCKILNVTAPSETDHSATRA